MTAIARKTIPLILAGGTALAMLGAVTQGDAQEAGGSGSGSGSGASLSCAIVTRDLGGMVEISGKVSAAQNASGVYALTIRQHSASGQAMIDQSGDFTVAAGRTVSLGQTSLGGTPGQYHAELTVTVGGKTYRCRKSDQHTDI